MYGKCTQFSAILVENCTKFSAIYREYLELFHGIQVTALLGTTQVGGIGSAVFAAIVSSVFGRNLKSALGIIGNISIGGAIVKTTNFSDRVSLLSENGAKMVLAPMDNLPEIASLPPTILGKTDVPSVQMH